MKKFTDSALALMLFSMALSFAPPAHAGPFSRRRVAASPCAGGRCQAPAPAPQVRPPAPAANDAGGFVAALNAHRAAAGLGPLAWSPQLAGDAGLNDASTARGGHTYNPGYYQCSAPVQSVASALAMWRASHAHDAILLTAGATVVGVATNPTGTTVNIR